MKIAFDHQIFTMQNYGGISRYYKKLAFELIKNNDVKIFAGLHQNEYLNDLPQNIVCGKKVKKYPYKSEKLFHSINYINCQAQSKRWKPDIIHETYYSALPRLKNSAVRITSVYDMIHEIFKNDLNNSSKTTKRKKKTFDNCDHIISISQSTKNDMVNLLGVESSKITVIHLGVDLELFQSSSRYKNIINEPYILYVGSRNTYKNFNGFIKACAISRQIKNKVNIVAFGGGSFTSSELEMFKNYGLDNTKILHLSGDDNLLSSLYSNALCFVYPSLYEGFGLPPLEAMAAKCPVVSSNTSSMPEVVNNAGIYFDPTNIEEMSLAIETVIHDNILSEKLINAGLENIKDFSWNKCSIKTLDLYKKLTNK